MGCPEIVNPSILSSHILDCDYNPRNAIECENGCGKIQKYKMLRHNCAPKLKTIITSLHNEIEEMKKLMQNFSKEIKELNEKIVKLEYENKRKDQIIKYIQSENENEMQKNPNKFSLLETEKGTVRIKLNINFYNKNFSFYVRNNDSIRNIKMHIQEIQNVAINEQILYINDMVMENNFSIQSYNNDFNLQLYLVLVSTTGMKIRIKEKFCIFKCFISDDYISVMPNDTIAQVKSKIFQQKRITVKSLTLNGMETVLIDSFTLENYGITQNMRLYYA